MSKYAVFLDIDGVFCSSRVHLGSTTRHDGIWGKFDPVALDFLNRLHDDYDVEFVLTSTWSFDLDVNDASVTLWMMTAFRNAGFRGYFPKKWKVNHTNDTSMRVKRAENIKNYLAEFEYDDFLILDDSDYNFNKVLGIKRFVKTSTEDGMLTKHMMNVLSLVGTWKKK